MEANKPASTPHVSRMVVELDELNTKLTALTAFRGTPIFEALPKGSQILMQTQADLMSAYAHVLSLRIEFA